jgi:hypothetical protein
MVDFKCYMNTALFILETCHNNETLYCTPDYCTYHFQYYKLERAVIISYYLNEKR